jgi:transcriptional repressor NrdR
MDSDGCRFHNAQIMRCPYCGSDNDHVIDSRSLLGGTSIRRRRECTECNRRFTTYEHIDEIPVMIKKKDGSREPFIRDKIATGIRVACQKRPVSEDQVQTMTSSVEQQVFSEAEKEVDSSFIGELVMKQLRDVDQVAYVRFASVYRSFKDVTEFMSELNQFLSSPASSSGKSRNRNQADS